VLILTELFVSATEVVDSHQQALLIDRIIVDVLALHLHLAFDFTSKETLFTLELSNPFLEILGLRNCCDWRDLLLGQRPLLGLTKL